MSSATLLTPASSSQGSSLKSSSREEIAVQYEVKLQNYKNPTDPINWTPTKKFLNLAVVSLTAFTTPMAASTFALAITQVGDEFHITDPALEPFIISIFALGSIFGPLIVAPASDIFGRRPVYMVCNALLCLFSICCSLSKSVSVLIASRFLAGCVASIQVTLGAAVIGDIFSSSRVGTIFALWSMCPIVGAATGPAIGGYLSVAEGWRWIFWFQGILAGSTLLIGILALSESNRLVVLHKIAKGMNKESSKQCLVPTLADTTPASARFSGALLGPLKLLFSSPVVLILSTYIALLFGYLYLYITTWHKVFVQRYDFSVGASGVIYLGLALGLWIGGLAGTVGSDVLCKRLTHKHGGDEKAEYRLPVLFVSMPITAGGIFFYGWSVKTSVHWMVPIFGKMLFGFGMMPGLISINQYLTSAYGSDAKSAIAATRILQAIFGGVLPVAGWPLYIWIGVDWANTVMGLVIVCFMPVPLVLFRYRERLRKRSHVCS